MDDVELVTRARQGETAAFGELVERHRTAVYRAALAALGSHADAEDAAQDAFLAAYRRLESFRGAASFKTWLLAIAWHEAINRRRSLRRLWLHWGQPFGRTEPTEPDGALASVADGGPTPEQALERGELMRIVQGAIGRLSPKLRDVLLLAQSGDYSYEEIGAMVGVPIGTIKWRVSEARRIIRQRLRERGYGDVADEHGRR